MMHLQMKPRTFFSIMVVELSSLDQKSFLYMSLLGHILRDPFLIGIPLGITKRGEQDISLYMQSWVASNPLSRSSAYPTPSTLTPLASWWCQPLGMSCRVLLPKSPFCRCLSMKADGCNCTPQLMLVTLKHRLVSYCE